MEDPSGFNLSLPDLDGSIPKFNAATPRHLKKPAGPANSSLRKRRRADEPLAIPVPGTFTIEPQSDFGETVTIKPLTIVPRYSIDLDWASAANNSRLFHADIPVLNAEDVVLIAKYNKSHQLAAIQRVGHPKAGTYVLFRLSGNLKTKHANAMHLQLGIDFGNWWKPVEVYEDEDSQSESEEWWGGAGLDQDILANAIEGAHASSIPGQLSLNKLLKAAKPLTLPKNLPKLKQDTIPSPSVPVALDDAEATPEYNLSRLRQQYYTLLYTSKSSLQYFPKTSLSRARVNFPTNGESPASRLDLLLCLENMVVSIEECDEKYRSGIREVSKARRAQGRNLDQLTIDQVESAIVPPACLRDNEIKYVLKWLKSQLDDDGPVRSIEQEDVHIQKAITELRSRETELQIIVILEILAIKSVLSEEKLAVYEKMKKAADRKRRRKEKAAETKDKKKRKKKMDPAVLLDLLVDRLCIWHSIGTGEEPKSAQPKPKDAKDRLRHFSIEIVAAYYSSRLPNICEEIRCKCTGKIKQARKEQDSIFDIEETQQDIFNEDEVEESMPDTMEETSIFSKSVHGSRAPLSRSLTAPVGKPHFERAESSFSISLHVDSQDLSFDLAAQVSQQKEVMKTSFRGGITNTKKTAERRVVEMANPRAKRRKTETEDETQLKDAIKKIAKPNRLAVAEEMVSASAQRMKITGRKPKKPIRLPVTNNTVQVAATPRKNAKTAHLLERKPDVPRAITEEEDVIPSSSQVVPQSTIKPNRGRSTGPYEVAATPSKAPQAGLNTNEAQRHSMLQSSPMCISDTPMRPKRSFMEALKSGSTSKPNFFITNTPSNPFRTSTDNRSLAKGFMNSIAETPTKPSISSKLRSSLLQVNEEETITSSPIQKPKPGTPANRSLISQKLEVNFGNDETDIYKTLGWDTY